MPPDAHRLLVCVRPAASPNAHVHACSDAAARPHPRPPDMHGRSIHTAHPFPSLLSRRARAFLHTYAACHRPHAPYLPSSWFFLMHAPVTFNMSVSRLPLPSHQTHPRGRDRTSGRSEGVCTCACLWMCRTGGVRMRARVRAGMHICVDAQERRACVHVASWCEHERWRQGVATVVRSRPNMNIRTCDSRRTLSLM